MSDHEIDPITADTVPASALPTRRAALRTGGLGVLTAAFLAACGSEDRQPGVAGAPPPTTATPPSAPPFEPNELDLEADDVQLQTLRTLELLVVEVYEEQGSELSGDDAELAERFRSAHVDAAEDLAEGAPQTEESSQPNTVVRETVVDPILPSLTSDRAVLDFMAQMESALTATYINAVGIHTEMEWRQRMAAHADACARRSAALAGGGEAGAPTAALFELDDLIAGEAYLLSPTDAALAEEMAAEADAAEAEDEG
jgi:hypothetical protein